MENDSSIHQNNIKRKTRRYRHWKQAKKGASSYQKGYGPSEFVYRIGERRGGGYSPALAVASNSEKGGRDRVFSSGILVAPVDGG